RLYAMSDKLCLTFSTALRFLTFWVRHDTAICTQRQDFAKHPHTVGNQSHFAAFMMIPTHRNFLKPQSSAVREQEQLHIKPKADDFRRFDYRTARLHGKGLETALRIPKRQTGHQPHQ